MESFVFAFTVLGPLHYLTELAWLRGRGLFTGSGLARALLLALAVVGSVAVLGVAAVPRLGPLAVGAMTAAVGVAAVAVLPRPGVAPLLGVAALGLALPSLLPEALARPLGLAFGLWLPTLVHVLAFTALFMLDGIRRRPVPHDRLCFVAFTGALLLLLGLPAPPAAPSPFDAAYATLIGFLEPWLRPWAAGDPAAWSARLLAFAYAHHFLNWFDKTARIGWTKLPPPLLAGVFALWLGIAAAYAVDLELGLFLATLPNVLHVMAELPLNLRTAQGLLQRA